MMVGCVLVVTRWRLELRTIGNVLGLFPSFLEFSAEWNALSKSILCDGLLG